MLMLTSTVVLMMVLIVLMVIMVVMLMMMVMMMMKMVLMMMVMIMMMMVMIVVDIGGCGDDHDNGGDGEVIDAMFLQRTPHAFSLTTIFTPRGGLALTSARASSKPVCN